MFCKSTSVSVVEVVGDESSFDLIRRLKTYKNLKFGQFDPLGKILDQSQKVDHYSNPFHQYCRACHRSRRRASTRRRRRARGRRHDAGG